MCDFTNRDNRVEQSIIDLSPKIQEAYDSFWQFAQKIGQVFHPEGLEFDTNGIWNAYWEELQRAKLATYVMRQDAISGYYPPKSDGYREPVYHPVTTKQAMLLHRTWAKANPDQPAEDFFISNGNEYSLMHMIQELHAHFSSGQKFTTSEAREAVPNWRNDTPAVMSYARKRKLVKYEKVGNRYTHWFECTCDEPQVSEPVEEVSEPVQKTVHEDFPYSDDLMF